MRTFNLLRRRCIATLPGLWLESSALLLAILCASPLLGRAQPIITRQPTNLSVSLGATALFRVTATSTSPPIAYQWRHEDIEIAWATNASLTVTNVQLADAGLYAVVVADAGGTTTAGST